MERNCKSSNFATIPSIIRKKKVTQDTMVNQPPNRRLQLFGHKDFKEEISWRDAVDVQEIPFTRGYYVLVTAPDLIPFLEPFLSYRVQCPKAKLFELRDDHGNVLETVNNSEGIYSMSQNLPSESPAVERRLMYETKGKDLIVVCPGNMNKDEPLKWQMGSKMIIPEIVNAESNGRIHISLADNIIIKNSKVSDSNVFSCWQNNELAGTVRLIIEKKLEMQFNHQILLIGLLIIVAVYLLIVTKALIGRKHAKVTVGDQ